MSNPKHSSPAMTAREELVLGTIIDLYIQTGEPVASQAVALVFEKREGMSSATIRNVMATLGDSGLLDQPYSSAGRIPTAAAFRAYVERFTEPGETTETDRANGRVNSRVVRFGRSSGLSAPDTSDSMRQAQMATETLSPERRGQIEESFSGVHSSTEYLERTSHVLALLSSGLGVAVAANPMRQVFEHIHFSRLGAGRVLAVVVSAGGSVQDRVLMLDRELNATELETAARYLNENFRGWQVDKIRAEVARRMEAERAVYHQLLGSIEELCRKGALAESSTGPTIFMEGMANLIGTELDRERLREMLSALEAKQRIVELLSAYVDARQHEVRVVVGLDETSPAMQDLVMIAAPARLGGETQGTIALIAPTRIQYQQMIQAVRYVAGLSERILDSPVQ